MKLYDEAFQAAAVVVNAYNTGELEGTMADMGISLPWVANMAINAGAGDHVEIGTLWGASAITVALAKKAAGLAGTVYCIDPWPKKRETVAVGGSGVKKIHLSNATITGVRRNIKKAEVDVKLIRAKSQPWPDKLKDHRFVSAYIDGNHISPTPMQDFEECAKRTEYYVGFDNYEEGYLDVMQTVHDICDKEEWSLYFKNFLFVAFRKLYPPRNAVLSNRLEHC